MPNPGGTNQFQGFSETIPYGDKARQGMLARLAPLAGDAAEALGAPKRDKNAAVKGRSAGPQQASELAPLMLPPLAQTPVIPSAQSYAAIASIPGASPLVQEVFGGGA